MNEQIQEIQAIRSKLEAAGAKVTDEQISEKLALLQKFHVIGDEAVYNAIRSLAREAGIDVKSLYTGSTTINAKLAELIKKDTWCNIEIQVIQLWDATSPSIHQTGLVGDESSVMKFTSWTSAGLPELIEGETYRVESAVTSIYNEKVQLNFNSKTKVIPLTKDIKVASNEIQFNGLVISIQKGSGIIKRCPECNRALSKGSCTVHGKVEGVYDLRIKAVIDNGETGWDLLCNAEVTTDLTGITIESAKEMAAEALDTAVVVTEIERKLMGKYWLVNGSQTGSRYLLVKSMEPTKIELNVDQVIDIMEVAA